MTEKKILISKESRDQRIAVEKRRRNQFYSSLDYLLSLLTYFDFFSFDAFKIAKHSKCLAQSFGHKEVTSEFLLLPFAELDSGLEVILKESKLTPSIIKYHLHLNREQPSLIQKILNRIPLIYWIDKFLDPAILDPSIDFSYHATLLFEKTAENALTRFKTPVITPEILFVTLMEEKKSNAGKIILKNVNNEVDWYLLRYKILKRIHYQELAVRNGVTKNQHYFGYLLKTQLTELEFNRMIERSLLDCGVTCFRHLLLHRVLETNMQELIELEVNKSIKVTNKRKYTA
jgi:hypothetical protein